MRNLLILLAVLYLGSCRSEHGGQKPVRESFSFYAGTYTDSGSRGIYKLLLHDDGTLEMTGLATEVENPSFLAMENSRRFLVSVNEISPGGIVESYLIRGDSLLLISRSPSGGDHPCFVTVNEKGYVLTANYTGGTVGLLKIDEKGKLSNILDVMKHAGKGTHERQDGPHAHSAWFIPGTDTVITVDLGTNELWFSVIDTIQNVFQPHPFEILDMEPGAGPRHLAFHPHKDWTYIINELNSTITMIKSNSGGEYIIDSSYSTLPDDYHGPNYCADIHITSDGKILYASNRGHNSLSVFTIDPGSGKLNLIYNQNVCGDWPRNFQISPDEKYLVVANQYSNNMVSFRIEQSGRNLEPVDTIKINAPVCILF